MVIIGLGNPGKKFENTRHNVGFMAIDEYARKNEFPEFELQKKSDSLISEKDSILLAKPETFMNESGKAIKAISKNIFLAASMAAALAAIAASHQAASLNSGLPVLRYSRTTGGALHK